MESNKTLKQLAKALYLTSLIAMAVGLIMTFFFPENHNRAHPLCGIPILGIQIFSIGVFVWTFFLIADYGND